jgi:FixJ family two-component response regulator
LTKPFDDEQLLTAIRQAIASPRRNIRKVKREANCAGIIEEARR